MHLRANLLKGRLISYIAAPDLRKVQEEQLIMRHVDPWQRRLRPMPGLVLLVCAERLFQTAIVRYVLALRHHAINLKHVHQWLLSFLFFISSLHIQYFTLKGI